MNSKFVFKSSLISFDPLPAILNHIFLIISGLQIVALSLIISQPIILHDTQIIEMMKVLVGSAHIDMISNSSKTLEKMFGILLYVYVLVNLLMISAGAILFCTNTTNKFFKFAWKLYLSSNFFIFALPTFNLIFTSLSNQSLGEDDEDHPYLIGFGSFLVISTMATSVLNLIFMIPLKTSDILSRSTNTYEIVFFLQRYLVSTGLIILRTEQSPPTLFIWVLLILNFILTLTAIYVLIKFQPFFYSSSNSLSLFFQTLALSFGLGGIIIRGLYDEKGISSTRLIFPSILFFPLLHKICRSYSSSFILSSISKSTKGGITQKEISSAQLAYLFSNLDRKIFFDPDHHIFPNEKMETIMLQSYLRSYQSEGNSDMLSCFRNYLNQAKASTDIKSIQKLLICYLTFSVLKDFFTAFYQAHEILSSSASSFNEKLGAQWIIQCIKIEQMILIETNEKGEIITSLKEIEKYERLLKGISIHLCNHIEMYKIMIEQHPCLKRLFDYTHRTQESYKDLEQSFNQMAQMGLDKCPKIIKFYSLFLITTKIDEERAVELYKQQNRLQIFQNSDPFRDHALHVITHPKSVFVSLSLNRSNFGEILKVSPSFVKLLGLSSSDYFRKKIDIIFPQCLKTFAEELLKEKFKSGADLHKLTNFKTLLSHKDGHLVPVTNYFILNPVINEDLTLLMILTPFEEKRNFVLFSQNGEYEGSSFYSDDFTLSESDLKKFFKLLPSAMKMNNSIINRRPTFIELKEDKSGYLYKSTLIQNENFKIPGFLVEINRIRRKSGSTKTKKSIYNKKEQNLQETTYPDFDDLPDEAKLTHIQIEYVASSFQVQESVQNTKESTKAEIKNVENLMKDFQNIQKSISNSSIEGTELFDEDNNKDKIFEASRSALSRSSDHIYSRIKNNLDTMIPKLSIFKFIQRHILFAFYLFFLGSFLLASYSSYINATNSVQEVIKSIEFLKNLYGRTAGLTDLFRNAYNDYLFKIYYDQNLEVTQQRLSSNAINSWVRINRIIKYHSEVKRLVNEINDKALVSHFYEKNIRIFYEDFSNLPNNDKYHLENSFRSYDILIQASDFLATKIPTNDSSLIYYRDFISSLALNDLFIQSRKYPELVQKSMENILAKISDQIETYFYVSITFLGIFLVIIILVTRDVFYKTSKFLNIMINSDSFEVLENTKILEEFRRKIKEELGDESVSKSRPNYVNIESRSSYREGNSKLLFIKFFILNTFLIFGLIVPNAILIFLNMDSSSQIQVVASEGAKSIRDINEVGLSVVEIISDAAIYDFMPHITSKNQNITDFYQQGIDDLDLVTSLSKGLSNTVIKDLSLDLCPYFVSSNVRPDCFAINNGQPMRGIKSSIFFLRDFLTSFKKWADSIPDTFEKRFILNNVTARVDVVYLCYNAINPAIRTFSSELTVMLIDDLNARVYYIVNLFDISISINIFIFFFMIIWVYKKMGGQRKVLLNFFNKMPLELLGTNKFLKHYLVKESKDFYNLLKDIETKYKVSRKKNQKKK